VTVIKKEIIKTPTVEKSKNISHAEQTSHSQKMTIAPSLDFMKKMQSSTLSNYEYNSQRVYKPKTLEKTRKREEVKKTFKKPTPPESKVVEEQKAVIPPKKSSQIRINRQNTHDDIAQVVARFNKNNNPALSLFIAKKYYELGDYRKSYNYALITNEINSDIEASWIVFAKALVKLNEKEMAVKTLRRYIKQSNSNRANILLDDITTGKFK